MTVPGKPDTPGPPEKPGKVKIDTPFPDRGKENLRQALEQTNAAIEDLTARVAALEAALQPTPTPSP